MKRRLLKEDRLPPRLPVGFSSKISQQINSIYTNNINNGDALYRWLDYIEGISRYMSNPVIAWDYTNRHRQWPNGARFVEDLGYNVGYKIISDRVTKSPFVYIFSVSLRPEEFGLNVPTPLKEGKRNIRLSESTLRRIIRNVLVETIYS